MQDWAAVPASLLAKTTELRKYFDLSFQHAANKKSKAKVEAKGKRLKKERLFKATPRLGGHCPNLGSARAPACRVQRPR